MKKKKWLVWFFIMILILAAANRLYNHLSTAYVQENPEEENTAAPDQADDFTVYDENKNEVRLSDYLGKPLVVNFWASWCPPCKREMPAFQKMMDTYGEDVTFLMVNETDGDRETMEMAQTFLTENGYQMNILYDLEEDAGNTYHLLYLPRTLFIDENGVIVDDHIGELSETDMVNAISILLSEEET